MVLSNFANLAEVPTCQNRVTRLLLTRSWVHGCFPTVLQQECILPDCSVIHGLTPTPTPTPGHSVQCYSHLHPLSPSQVSHGLRSLLSSTSQLLMHVSRVLQSVSTKNSHEDRKRNPRIAKELEPSKCHSYLMYFSISLFRKMSVCWGAGVGDTARLF